MTPEQQKIYLGLKNIGQEIADFYSDAISLIDNDNYKSRSHLIAHLAREISDGIIEILIPKAAKKESTKSDETKTTTNLGRILLALECDNTEELAHAWFKISKQFPGLAHRHGAWKETRQPDKIIKLWNDFEKILSYLAGSFYAIISRLDTISHHNVPTDDMLGTLKNLLKNPRLNEYFFQILDKPDWLDSLIKEKYFDVKNAPKQTTQNLWPNAWSQIKYLLKSLPTTDVEIEKKIINIIQDIKVALIQNDVELNPLTIGDIAEIICKLKTYTFSQNDIQLFGRIATENRIYVYHNDSFLNELTQLYIDIKNQEGLVNLMTYFLGYIVIENKPNSIQEKFNFDPTYDVQYNINEHILDELFNRYLKGIIQIGQEKIIKLFVDTISDLSQVKYVGFTASFIPSIEKTNQSSHEREYTLLQFISEGYIYLDLPQQFELVRELLNHKAYIFKRLGFHIVKSNFTYFKAAFFEYCNAEKLSSLLHTHELYLLIKSASPNFTDEELSKIVEWIENMTDAYDDNANEQYKHRKIQRLINALTPTDKSQQQFVNSLTTKYGKFVGDHPEHEMYSNPHFVFEAYDQKDIEAFKLMSPTNQIKYLKEYKSIEPFHDIQDDLGFSFKNCIVEQPSNYLFQLDDFIEIPFQYQHRIIEAFSELYRQEQLTDASFVISYISKKVSGPSFATEKKTLKPDYKDWFVSDVGRFFRDISRDYNVLTKENIKNAIAVILILLRSKDLEQEFLIRDNRPDYISYIYNAMPGILHTSLLSMVDLYKKDLSEDVIIKWPIAVKEYYDELVKDKTKKSSSSVILGYYFPYLLFVDPEWSSTNYDNIFPKSAPEIIDNAIGSLLTPNQKHSKKTLQFIKEKSLIKFAVSRYTSECNQLSGLCRLAILEYNHLPDSDTNESIVSWIIENKNENQISQLVSAALEFRHFESDKIITFWKKITELLLSKSIMYKSIQSECLKFVGDLENIDSTVIELINFGIQFLENGDRNAYFLVKDLLENKTLSIDIRGTLIYEAINKAQLFSLPEAQIKSLVEQLYTNGFNEIATKICMHVMEGGYLFLKSIYDAYNKPKF